MWIHFPFPRFPLHNSTYNFPAYVSDTVQNSWCNNECQVSPGGRGTVHCAVCNSASNAALGIQIKCTAAPFFAPLALQRFIPGSQLFTAMLCIQLQRAGRLAGREPSLLTGFCKGWNFGNQPTSLGIGDSRWFESLSNLNFESTWNNHYFNNCVAAYLSHTV